MNNQGILFYTEKHERYSKQLKSITWQIKRFALYRLVSFILIFIPVSVIGTYHWLTWLLTIIFILFFFFLVKKNIQTEKKKKKVQILKNWLKMRFSH